MCRVRIAGSVQICAPVVVRGYSVVAIVQRDVFTNREPEEFLQSEMLPVRLVT